MLSGAVEATAIRSSPNGHGWWLDNREAWDAQGGVSRFPTAGTCTGYSAATLTWMSLIWRRVRRQVIKMTGGGAPEQLLSSYSQVSPPPSIQLPRNGKRFSQKWGGWGTTSSSSQLSKFLLPLDTQAEATGSTLNPQPSSLSPHVNALKSSLAITHSHVLPSFLALLTCVGPGYKHRLCVHKLHSKK